MTEIKKPKEKKPYFQKFSCTLIRNRCCVFSCGVERRAQPFPGGKTGMLSVVTATMKERRVRANGKCSRLRSPLRRPSCTLPLMLSPMNVGTLSFLSMTHTSTVKPCRCAAVVLKDTWSRSVTAQTHPCRVTVTHRNEGTRD